MDAQARQLAELFSAKAGKDELIRTTRQASAGLQDRFQAELDAKATKMAELISQAKTELQSDIDTVGVSVERKADRQWLDDLEAQIKAQIVEMGEGHVTEELLQQRLAALRASIDKAMAAQNVSEGSFLSFRCLACDRPLPRTKDWKAKPIRPGPSASIRDGPPTHGDSGADACAPRYSNRMPSPRNRHPQYRTTLP
jgi:hypothetical protein